MFRKMKILVIMTTFLTVSFVYATQPWEGEEPYSVSEYCLLEDGNSVLGGLFTEFHNEETTGCIPFAEQIVDYIDFGETVYSVAGDREILAVGFYNRVALYNVPHPSEPLMLYEKTVYGPASDLVFNGSVLYIATENGVSSLDLDTGNFIHKHTYGTTKALRIHDEKLYVGDGQGIKVMDLDTLDIIQQRNTSGDVTNLEIMDGVIYTFEWAGLKRFDLSTLAPISTCCYNPYEPELKAYDGTLYAFGNNSVRKITFNGSSVVTTAMTGDRVELRNNYTHNEVTFFPDGNGIRVSYLEKQHPSNDDYDNYMLANYNTVLGDQTESPYRVINLMAARDSLVAKGILQPGEVTDEDLAPTHYYVMFEPQDEDEWDILDGDEELNISSIPLDREIVEHGLFYHDPSITGDQPTYQYAVVRVDQQLPNVPYFILDHLVLEPEDEEDMTTFFLFYFPILRIEAIEILEIDVIPPLEVWHPFGRVRVWDSSLGDYVPVPNLRIKVTPKGRSSFGEEVYVITDEQGNFSSPVPFDSPEVKYKIKWRSRGNFQIRVWAGSIASYSTTKPRPVYYYTNFDLKLHPDDGSKDRKQVYYAHAYRAADFYLREDKYNIGTELFEGTRRLKIAVRDREGRAEHNPARKCQVHLFNIWKGSYMSSSGFFRDAIHELAHHHHYRFKNYVQWASVSKRIKEAWAMAVEVFFAYEVYPSQTGFFQKSHTLSHFYDTSSTGGEEKYNTIIIDLLEGDSLPYSAGVPSRPFPYSVFNQRDRFGCDGPDWETYVIDNVYGTGLSLVNIKWYVANNREFTDFRDKIARMPVFYDPQKKSDLLYLFSQFNGKKNVIWCVLPH